MAQAEGILPITQPCADEPADRIQPVDREESKARAGFLAWIDDNLEKPFLITGMLAIILIITYQTGARYLVSYVDDPTTTGALKDALAYLVNNVLGLSRNITWTEETSRFIFIWISYLAIPVAIKQRSNIRVDIVYDKLSPRWQRICWIAMDLCFLAFALVVCFMGAEQIVQQMEYPQTTPALRISYIIPYMVLPVAFGLMSIRIVQDMLNEVRKAGLRDSLLAAAGTTALASPVLLSSDFDALPLLFGYFALLLVIGVPVAVSLGLAALATILGAGTLPIEYVATTAFNSIDSFPIMAIPFFIAAGVFMGAGGLSHRLLRLPAARPGPPCGSLALGWEAPCE